MADDLQYGVALEPPVSVSNGLLEAARRLAVEVGARLPGVRWALPERYLAPLAFVSGASLPGSAEEGLRRGVRDVEELGLQAGFPVLVDDGARGRVLAPVTSKGDELARALESVARGLADAGLEVRRPDAVAVVLATVEGVESLERVRAALGAPRESPLAGWLAGGLWVAAGPLPPPDGPWQPRRLHHQPLKRLATRRPAPLPPRPAEAVPPAPAEASPDGPAPGAPATEGPAPQPPAPPAIPSGGPES